MPQEKPYLEGYFGVVHDPIMGLLIHPIDKTTYRDLEDNVAEVNIPLNTPDIDYCAICMLVDRDNSYIALREMVTLQGMMSSIVAMWRTHFKPVDLE